MFFLKKKNNTKVKFVRKDKIIIIPAFPFFFKFLLNNFKQKFIIWRSVNTHFLWRLRNVSLKILNLSSEFLKKFY